MEPNVCSIDRLVRVALGVVLVVVGLVAFLEVIAVGTTAAVGALLVGLVLLGTGTMRLCPLYSLLGVDTCGGQ
ncbi:YgaP-like transmembrane domain [Natrarchaeobaculum aegyptiacum]|uniref:Inner membrane protein YgaP-like transmembrane domain-containing protein n=1 Tax=Natrarchaeobaculum aegyptiacum TaxID=745377 RepID=A0A2Z2HQN6_9EURY|nr:YgaP-like transmembrane domain [Natrarchaeobaculum aegyptiacum]ARS89431.1 hypothetical protein B1756_06515 [Natrarchaeobaculum aegyptiacum]